MSGEQTAAMEPAYRNLNAHLRLWICAVAGFAADQLSKHWAITRLGTPEDGQPEPFTVIEGYVRFYTVFNPGAVWGSFAGNKLLLIGISAVAVVFLLGFFATSRAGQKWLHVGLGAILAGALGNMYDRIFNNGYVIDFIEINLHFPPADPWPTFNIADMLLCAGVGIIILIMLFDKPEEHGGQ